MRKELTPIGGDIALVFDPEIRHALRLRTDNTVDVEVQGDVIIVRRCDPNEPDPISDAFHRIVENPETIHQGRANPHGTAKQ